MTKLARALFVLFLISTSACTQGGEKSGKLVGRWMNTSVDGDAIECPDLLVFDSDGRYSILNDCYGKDPRNPVTESGKWIFSSSASQLRLSDRVFVTNYSLWERTEELQVRVEKLSSNTLTLTFGEEVQAENYKKLEKPLSE